MVRYLDGHDPLGRSGRTRRPDSGWELRDACAEAGFDLDVKLLPPGYKDAAAAVPLGTLDMELVRELTRDLQEKDGLPQWEAARVAVLTT